MNVLNNRVFILCHQKTQWNSLWLIRNPGSGSLLRGMNHNAVGMFFLIYSLIDLYFMAGIHYVFSKRVLSYKDILLNFYKTSVVISNRLGISLCFVKICAVISLLKHMVYLSFISGPCCSFGTMMPMWYFINPMTIL